MSEPVIGVSGGWNLGAEVRPARALDFATVGNIGTAPNKQDGIEYHRNYTVSTNDAEFWKALGEGSTVKADAERAASGALNGQQALNMTVVVVPEGESQDPVAKRRETIANIAGNAADMTGVYTWAKAASQSARVPRNTFIGGGYGAFIEDDAANPAVTALAAVNEMIFGFSYIDGPNSTEEEAKKARKLYSSKRLALIETAAQVYDDAGVLMTVAAAPFAAGLQAFVDMEKRGIPSHLAAMRSLGIAKPGREVPFDLNLVAIEGQRLLQEHIGFIARGDSMQDFAVADGGNILVAAHTLSSDPLKQFINVVRMQDYLQLGAMKVWRDFLVKENQSFAIAKNGLRTVQGWLNMLAGQSGGGIIYPNPSVEFIKSKTSPDDWRAGKLKIKALAEPRAPLMSVYTEMNRDRNAIDVELSQLETYARINF